MRKTSDKKTEGKLIRIGIKVKSHLDQIYEGLYGDLTGAKVKGLFMYFSVISSLEVMAYLYKGIFSMLAARCWLITGVLCLISIITYFVREILQIIKEKRVFPVAAVLLLILLLVSFWGNIKLSDINPDATQQAAAGLDSFGVKDFNYTGKAFLGYPNRQYIIAAIPAMLFGRSIFTLHMGFGYPFLLGLILLFCAFARWARERNQCVNITVLPLYAMLVFPYITEYYTNFEQAIYPVSFTMLGIGFFLLYLNRPGVMNTIGLAWVGGLLGNSYTPALASLGLMVVFLTLTSIGLNYRPEKLSFKVPSPAFASKVLLMIVGNVSLFFLVTLVTKREDRITQLRKDIDIIRQSRLSIYEFLTDKNATFLGVFGLIVLIYLIAGLTFQLRIRDALLSLWILGVVVASNLMLGYISYEPAWTLQRAMIIIPVFLTAGTLTLLDMLYQHKLKVNVRMIAVITAAFLFLGLNNFKQVNQSFLYFHYIQSMKFMWEDLEDTVDDMGLKAEEEFNLVLYTDNILIKNLSDYCKFLYPKAKVYTPESGEYPSDLDSDFVTILYRENGLPQLPQIAQMEVKTFENKKYNHTYDWYKGVVE